MTRSDGAFVLGIVFTLVALWFAASKDWIVVAPANSLPCEIKPPGTEAYRVGTLVRRPGTLAPRYSCSMSS